MMHKIKYSSVLLAFLFFAAPFFFNNCITGTKVDLQDYDTQTLVDRWLTAKNSNARHSIIAQLEKQKDLDGLIGCLKNARYLHEKTKNSTVKHPLIRDNDVLPIIRAIGRLKNPDTIDALQTLKVFSNKKVQLSLLAALEQINDPESVDAVASYLKNTDSEVRLKAVFILASFNTRESSDAVLSIIFDEDPNVRWKAVHALGQMKNPEAVEKIGLLLNDKDTAVRNSAEQVLKKLGIEQERINQWKENVMSVDDMYKTRQAYEKAVLEKDELIQKVETLEQVKQQLEGIVKKHAAALKTKEHRLSLVSDSKQQLISKNQQLEISSRQSEKYLQQIELLNAKLIELNRQIRPEEKVGKTNIIKAELDKTIFEKEKFEQELQASRSKEVNLKKEVAELEKLSEDARIEVKNAQLQVEKMAAREMSLLKEVANLKKRSEKGMKPIVLVSGPDDNSSVQIPYAMLNIFAVDDKGIKDIKITLNENPVELDMVRGIKAVPGEKKSNKINIKQRIKLLPGKNIIRVTATDITGAATQETLTIMHSKEKGQIFAAIIGINDYQTVRKLKYAVNDAAGFRDYLKNQVGIPETNLFYLADTQATKENLQKLLGTHLKRIVSKEDSVFIFFAGHGAVESDPANPDGDGFEKYLLPYDADLDDLYTSSISMDEIRKIFQRIRSERLIFIADSCYSGASGGRTILTRASRAGLSDNFLSRISKSKGRVIISSCAANEVSQENDFYKHGLFTYFFLKGLKGAADFDNDSLITVSEVFSYVSKMVPKASGQDQHPVKKGASQGQLIIGITD